VAGFCEHGNETSGSIKCREFDKLRNVSLSRNLLCGVHYLLRYLSVCYNAVKCASNSYICIDLFVLYIVC
jgi:hypothetical protein